MSSVTGKLCQMQAGSLLRPLQILPSLTKASRSNCCSFLAAEIPIALELTMPLNLDLQLTEYIACEDGRAPSDPSFANPALLDDACCFRRESLQGGPSALMSFQQASRQPCFSSQTPHYLHGEPLLSDLWAGQMKVLATMTLSTLIHCLQSGGFTIVSH